MIICFQELSTTELKNILFLIAKEDSLTQIKQNIMKLCPLQVMLYRANIAKLTLPLTINLNQNNTSENFFVSNVANGEIS